LLFCSSRLFLQRRGAHQHFLTVLKEQIMENEPKGNFLQGWGLIVLIIGGTIGALVGLKVLLGW
jgi:hypothetical protein